MLYRSVDNIQVPLTPEEEAEVRAEWAAAEAQESVQKEMLEVKVLRERALEILLEELLVKNSNLPEVKLYLDKKLKN